MSAIFIPFSKLCWALGLSVFCGTYVGHWVCLFFVGLMSGIGFVSVVCGNYVGHWVCLFLCWGIMFGIVFVCYLWDLCWALGLSVCWLGDLCLVMVGLFGISTAD